MVKKYTFILLFLSSVPALWAHPVSFKGATSVMIWNQPYLNDIMTTYSFHRRAAVAGQYMRMDMEDGEMKLFLPQLNTLVKRWNGFDSQANVYLSGGWGGYEFQGRKKTGALGSVEADYETRKVYFSSKGSAIAPSFGPNIYHLNFRAGLATYESEFDDISSWFIVEVQHNTQLIHAVNVTPLLRLFYKNFLTEIGSSLEGDWMLNFMVHY